MSGVSEPVPGEPPDPQQEDETWRDLVARLGGARESEAGPAPRELSAAERAAGGAPPRGHPPGRGLIDPGRARHRGDASPLGEPRVSGQAEGHGAGDSFSRFDPLGLAGRLPPEQEPSEQGTPERGASAREAAAAAAAAQHSDGHEEALPGDFVPADPAPVLAGADPVAVLAWCGALGGPAGLLACALVWRSVPGFAIVLLIAAFVAGVGTLIMRLPGTKDDDGDDGARI